MFPLGPPEKVIDVILLFLLLTLNIFHAFI